MKYATDLEYLDIVRSELGADNSSIGRPPTHLEQLTEAKFRESNLN